MTWAMQDVAMNRPPLSRWHQDYMEKFEEYVFETKQNQKFERLKTC